MQDFHQRRLATRTSKHVEGRSPWQIRVEVVTVSGRDLMLGLLRLWLLWLLLLLLLLVLPLLLLLLLLR